MAFTCPRCGRTSHNPNDEREGYCGACHDWTGTSSPPAEVWAGAAEVLGINVLTIENDGSEGAEPAEGDDS
jgi:hypothetical protein